MAKKTTLTIEFYTQELHSATLRLSQREIDILKETSVLSSHFPEDKDLMTKIKSASRLLQEHPFYEIKSLNDNDNT